MSSYREGSGRAGNNGAPAGEELGTGSFDERNFDPVDASRAPSFEFRPSEIEAYRDTGLELIPLHAAGALDYRGRPLGKAPRKGWRTSQALSVDEARELLEEGTNVGVRLRAADLVVDVDPRNFDAGDDPLTRLQTDLGIDLRPDSYPRVVTGSGGFHIYMRLAEPVSVRDSLAEYPGIEFKGLGRQVVAAGSSHSVKRSPYLWDDDPLRVEVRHTPIAPAKLITLIQRPPNEPCGSVGEVSPETLAGMLDGLDATRFRDQSKWLELMMACHHATAGEGREEFISWSTSDPVYAADGGVIGHRWDSLRADESGRRVTQKTLFKALVEAGRLDLLPRASAEEDFDGIDDEQPQPPSSIEREGVADEWVYVIDSEVFVRRSDGKKWKRDQWKAKYAGLREGDIVNAVFKGAFPVRKFESLVYLPGEPEFPDGEDEGRYNIWRQSGVEPKQGDVQPFLDHMRYLFSDEAERGYVLDYLAMLVQQPGQKVNYALLVKGGQGTGKSWIGRLMTRIIGQRNVIFPSNGEVMSQWTVWTEGAQLGIIEELMANGRIDMANRLKPIITDPWLRIESKGFPLYSIPNRLNLMAFTNHDDAVPIERGDRRWMIVFSDAEPHSEEYYGRLWAFLDGDGPAAVKHWLLQRQIDLNPKGMAPKTVGKDAMRRLTMGEAEQVLSERLEEGVAPFDFPLVRFEEVLAAVPSDIARRSSGLRNRVTKWLTGEVRAVKHSRYKKQDGAERPNCHLWSIRDHAHWEAIGAAGRIDAFQARYLPKEQSGR